MVEHSPGLFDFNHEVHHAIIEKHKTINHGATLAGQSPSGHQEALFPDGAEKALTKRNREILNLKAVRRNTLWGAVLGENAPDKAPEVNQSWQVDRGNGQTSIKALREEATTNSAATQSTAA